MRVAMIVAVMAMMAGGAAAQAQLYVPVVIVPTPQPMILPWGRKLGEKHPSKK